ncbi:MAG: hypothetical protein KGI98_14575 [Euryarchaeota archaeon]|nr:hypothetical protein [Euryarchaeota archaeon]MDE1881170.1 hypothetical protein [Euryarchaeota archaeon]
MSPRRAWLPLAVALVVIASGLLAAQGHLSPVAPPRAAAVLPLHPGLASSSAALNSLALACGAGPLSCALYGSFCEILCTAPTPALQDTPYLETLVGDYSNSLNLTTGLGVQLSEQLLNISLPYWEDAASAAALEEFNYTHFDPGPILMNSGIGAELASIPYALTLTSSNLFNESLIAPFQATFDAGGAFCPNSQDCSTDILELDQGSLCYTGGYEAGNGNSCSTPKTAGDLNVYETLPNVTSYLYLRAGAPIDVQCGLLQSVAVYNDSSHYSVSLSGDQQFFVPESGVYSTNNSATGCRIGGPGVQLLEGPGTSLTWEQGLCGGQSLLSVGCNPQPKDTPTSSPFWAAGYLRGPPPILTTGVAGAVNVTGQWDYLMGTEIPAIVQQSVSAAQAYLTYLKGAFPSGNIPSNCTIPMPSWAAPPYLSAGLGGMSTQQLIQLYAAMMAGLGQWAGSSSNFQGYCLGHPNFPGLGNLTWSGGDENITGMIYTLPVGSQTLSNPATWAVSSGGQPVQLVLWPATANDRVPLTTVTDLQVTNPIYAYVPSLREVLTLRGNLTSSGASDGKVGAALYLTTCVISGGAENPCQLQYDQVVILPPTVTCPLGATTCQTPSPPGGTGGPVFPPFSIGAPCTWPGVNAVCGAFNAFLGAFALIGEIVLLVVFVVIIFVAASFVLGLRDGGKDGG